MEIAVVRALLEGPSSMLPHSPGPKIRLIWDIAERATFLCLLRLILELAKHACRLRCLSPLLSCLVHLFADDFP